MCDQGVIQPECAQSVNFFSWPWHDGVTEANTPVTKCGPYPLTPAVSFCVFSQTSFLIMIVLFTRLFFSLLYSPYQGISFSSKVLRSELSYFRRSHSFSSTVWTTTSDQSFEIIDFKSHSATCAHYVTTTNRPWVVESARSLSQTSVSTSLSPFCIG